MSFDHLEKASAGIRGASSYKCCVLAGQQSSLQSI